MEKRDDIMQSPEMIALLEQLRRDINEDIERRKLAYIGKDGHTYYDIESLNAANKLYVQTMYTFIGKDGRSYGSTQDLEAANNAYFDYMNPKIEKPNLYDDIGTKGFRR